MSRAERYEEAVKLDRSAMAIRDELRRSHPSERLIARHLERVRGAARRI